MKPIHAREARKMARPRERREVPQSPPTCSRMGCKNPAGPVLYVDGFYPVLWCEAHATEWQESLLEEETDA